MTLLYALLLVIITGICWLLLFRKKGTPPKSSVSPPALIAIFRNQVAYYRNLGEAEQRRFEQQAAEFLDQVHLEGVGLEITDTDRALVAASAIIPIFGFPEWRYRNLTNVILYPDTFNDQFQFEGEQRQVMGMVGNGPLNGQMLLSRRALAAGFSTAAGKSNTGIHEFVHLLDNSDGATDGIPETLVAHSFALPWLKLMHTEMARIRKGDSDIPPYALTNEAEFLAVSSEYFFEKPAELKHKHPDLYRQLSSIFGQDPAQAAH